MSNSKAGSAATSTLKRGAKNGSRKDERMTEAVRVLARLARGVEIACQKSHLSLAQYRLLGIVAQSPQRASELASRASVSKPTLTSLIDGLAERDLVRREQVEGDRRGIRLEVTEEGAAALKLADDLLSERLTALTAEDPEAHLVEGLLQIGEALDREWDTAVATETEAKQATAAEAKSK